MMKGKYIGKAEALDKARRFCAYQDRCHLEMRMKLLEWGQRGDDLEDILASLVEDGFLNEERFARSFARGKFRFKQWGRLRIVRELRSRQVSDYCIKMGLSEIPEEEYRDTLTELISKQVLAGADLFKARQYCIRKGYEPGLVQDMTKD